METLQDLINYDNDSKKMLKRWESDPEFRKTHSLTNLIDKTTVFIARHIALQYYLLDNYIDIDGETISLFEAYIKLGFLKSIRKVATKDDKQDVILQLDGEIPKYENKIEMKIKTITLVKPVK